MSANQQASMGARLADRVRPLGIAARTTDDLVAEPIQVPDEILRTVREALLNGETHYTSRPGIAGLRVRIADALLRLGAPSFDAATEVIITAGERESLFVTLLALRAGAGVVWTAADVARYEALFSLMGLTPKALTDLDGDKGRQHQMHPAPPTRLAYRDRGATTADHDRMMRLAIASAVTDVLNVGAAVGDAAVVALPPIGPATVVIGGLDALPGQHAFGAGFVAGPAALLNPIRTWKQAFSICTAAPSQRAALAAMGSAPSADQRKETV
jgi:aspartate/methionine/tyrosine aminotransferase